MTDDLKHKIKDDVKSAMRSKDKARLAALRLIQAALKQKEVDEHIELNDEQTITILTKMAKQHRDSIEQFTKAGRSDLVKIEQFELDLIESYLPEKLSDEQINQLIDETILSIGATSMKDMGKIMKRLKAKSQGRADLSQVSRLIKARLSK